MAKDTQKVKKEAAVVAAGAAGAAGAAPEGFLTHYATLQETARALREQTEPDLDALIPLVDRALAAYKGCKSRIEAVQSLLDQRLATVDESEAQQIAEGSADAEEMED